MPKSRPDGRGGYQQPSKPAPVSGPGALSQRTDGRAGDAAGRLVNDAPSTGYGEKAALQQAQSQIPAGRSAPQGPMQPPDMFGPTRRPGEPITAGAAAGAGPGPANLLAEDPHVVLRALAAAYPHPDIIRLAQHYGVV